MRTVEDVQAVEDDYAENGPQHDFKFRLNSFQKDDLFDAIQRMKMDYLEEQINLYLNGKNTKENKPNHDHLQGFMDRLDELTSIIAEGSTCELPEGWPHNWSKLDV